MSTTFKIALLDMYNGAPNLGMKCINDILLLQNIDHIHIQTFNVRQKNELPDTSFDLYISSGGPGDPALNQKDNTTWEKPYLQWLDAIFDYNQIASKPKYLFVICHSLQILVQHLNLAEVKIRRSPAFGVTSIALTKNGEVDAMFAPFKAPIYTIDNRSYQILANDHTPGVLAIEKERSHVPLQRALMALRVNNYVVGTQFHPEASAIDMQVYLDRSEKDIVEKYGLDKYNKTKFKINKHFNAIQHTQATILPEFIQKAYQDFLS